MSDSIRHPIVPVERPDEDDEPLERYRVAKWVPIAVPLLAVLMALMFVFLIGQVL